MSGNSDTEREWEEEEKEDDGMNSRFFSASICILYLLTAQISPFAFPTSSFLPPVPPLPSSTFAPLIWTLITRLPQTVTQRVGGGRGGGEEERGRKALQGRLVKWRGEGEGGKEKQSSLLCLRRLAIWLTHVMGSSRLLKMERRKRGEGGGHKVYHMRRRMKRRREGGEAEARDFPLPVITSSPLLFQDRKEEEDTREPSLHQDCQALES